MENTTNTTAQNSETTTNASEGGLAGLLGNLNVTDLYKQYGGAATKALGRLSTTQKIIGGAVLLLGAGFLSGKLKSGGLKPKAKK
jgi:hypothetical protein